MEIMSDTTDYFDGAERVLRGLTALAVPLELKYVTKATYEPVYLDARARDEAFQLARSGKLGGYQSLRELRGPTDLWLTDVRNYLTAFLGDGWSPAWAQLGFMGPTLEMPRRDAGRCQFLTKLNTYFTNNPQFENAAKEYTAAKALALCTPFTGGRQTVEDCLLDTRQKRDARDAARALLDKQLVRLRKELELTLDDTDPRWLNFFDRIPGDTRVPEQVEEPTATVEPGKILVDWPDAERALRYRVERLVVGTDQDFVVAATVDDSDAELEGVPAGATVKLRVVAVNSTGPGAASPVIELLAA